MAGYSCALSSEHSQGKSSAFVIRLRIGKRGRTHFQNWCLQRSGAIHFAELIVGLDPETFVQRGQAVEHQEERARREMERAQKALILDRIEIFFFNE